jgi:hypothetical protein
MMSKKYRGVLIFLVLLVFGQCEYKDMPPSGTAVVADCTQSSLAITVESKIDASACNLIDGSITVSASAGTAPYEFSINGGAYQTSSGFSKLGPGVYTLNVQDAVQCTRSISVTISSPQAGTTISVNATQDNNCLTANGTITLTPNGGARPYTYQFGTGTFGTDSVFSNLKSGLYTITVKDSSGCPIAVNVSVPRGSTGVSYQNDIKPIMNASCAISGCHNGDNGSIRNWTIFANVQSNAQDIKLRTGNKSMPLTGSLTQDQINLIACWVDDGALNN